MPDNVVDNKEDVQNKDKNIEIIDNLKANYEAQIAAEKNKYTVLLENYIKNISSSDGDNSKNNEQPSEAEKVKRIGELSENVRDNKLNALEQAKAMIEIDDYVTESGERSIFAYTHGELDGAELESIKKIKDVLKDSIEKADGDVGVFQSAVVSKLVEFR